MSTSNATCYYVRYIAVADGTMTEYELVLDGHAGPLQPDRAGRPASSETFTVTGLNASTAYYFAVRAVDEEMNWSGMALRTGHDPDGQRRHRAGGDQRPGGQQPVQRNGAADLEGPRR